MSSRCSSGGCCVLMVRLTLASFALGSTARRQCFALAFRNGRCSIGHSSAAASLCCYVRYACHRRGLQFSSSSCAMVTKESSLAVSPLQKGSSARRHVTHHRPLSDPRGNRAAQPLPGTAEVVPVVFVLLYPLGGSIYDDVDICAVAYAASLGIFAVGVDGVEDRTNQFGGRRLQSGRP